MEMGIAPAYISIGTAAGMKRYLAESDMAQSVENAQKVLADVCKLEITGQLAQRILGNYKLLLEGATLPELLKTAQEQKHLSLLSVI